MGLARDWLKEYEETGGKNAGRGTGLASQWLDAYKESHPEENKPKEGRPGQSPAPTGQLPTVGEGLRPLPSPVTANAVSAPPAPKTQAYSAPAAKTKAKSAGAGLRAKPAKTTAQPVTAAPKPAAAPAADYATLAEVQKSQSPVSKKTPAGTRAAGGNQAPAAAANAAKSASAAARKNVPETTARKKAVTPGDGGIMIPQRPENNVLDDYATLRELGGSYYMPGVGRTINRGQGAEQRAWNTVSGAAKLSAGGIAGLGGLIAENLEALDRTAARSTTEGQRAIQEAENIRRYRSMLENGTWADGTPLTTADRYKILGYIQNAQSYINLETQHQDAVHSPIQQAQKAAYDTARRWTESGQRDVDKAKEDLGDLGKFAVDVGVAGVQMGLDFAPSVLTGGGSALFPMFLRSAGGAALTGKDSGADLATRNAYALGSGTLSVLTEQISNIAGPFRKMFGAGAAEKIAARLVERFGENQAVQIMTRLAQTPAGRTALSAFGEGFEELVESFFQAPLQRATINPDAKFDPAEAGYEFLVGAALGGLGGGVDVLKRAGVEEQIQQAQETEALGGLLDLVQQLQEQIQVQEQEAQAAEQETQQAPDLMDLILQVQQQREAERQPQETPAIKQEAAQAPSAPTAQQETAPRKGTVGYTEEEANSIRREGRTFRNIIAGIDSTVSDFFTKWKNGRSVQKGDKLEKLYLGKMSSDTLQKVEAILGYDIDSRDFILTNDDVKHILDHHGDAAAEIAKGNVPLTQRVIDALPEIVAAPDSVEPGHLEDRAPHRQSVVFKKTLPDGTAVYVQFDNSGRGTFQGRTLYVKK